jgi:serine phosphatase RsbU (regulator of sigma subunit)
MISFLSKTAARIWPDFESLDEPDRLALLRELFGTLFGLPFLAAALIWLVAGTDLTLLREQWPVLLLMLGLSVLAGRLSFFQISVGADGSYDYNGSSLEMVIVTSAVLLFGPTAAWIPFFGRLIDYRLDRPPSPSTYQRANRVRNIVYNLGPSIVVLLLALVLYQGLGGQFPLTELTPAAAWPAFAAVLFWLPWDGLFILTLGFLLAYFQLESPQRQEMRTGSGRRMFLFFLVANLPAFFGILAAAIYSQLGLFAYLYLTAGVLLASLLARRLSQQAMLSSQRSREVTQLEQLGRAIITAPVDASTLHEVLADHVPRMFGYHQLEIRLFAGPTLLRLPDSRPAVRQEIWEWLRSNPQPAYFAPGETLPWTQQASAFPLYLTPILSSENAVPLGGIYLALDRLVFEETVMDLGPALQVLAAQIASALHQADMQRQTLAHQKTIQELDFAWQIQASFLPDTLPEVDGWQLTAVLNPCRETSGDFYDVIALPNGRLGILIADVADKGLGAALFMALSRTLIRTYAFEYPTRPELVLQATNQRILSDTRSEMFVTVFYGILDPGTGELTYANAGHNPPYLFRDPLEDNSQEAPAPLELGNTGMPLGIIEEASWEAESVTMDHGDTLIMYTDGITEAQNLRDELFGNHRLIEVFHDNLGAPVLATQDAILDAVDRFSDDGALCDDETLVIIKRQ